MENFEKQLAKLLLKYNSDMDNFGRHIDTLAPPSRQFNSKIVPTQFPDIRQEQEDMISVIPKSNNEQYGDFLVSNFKRVKLHYPLIYEIERGRLKPILEELEAEYQEWAQYLMEKIHAISRINSERNAGKQRYMFNRLMNKLNAPYLVGQHTRAVEYCKTLVEPPSTDIVHTRWGYDPETAENQSHVLHQLTLKQKFGLSLLLTKAGLDKVLITSGFRTIERQGELMVKNDLMVNHPSYPQGTGTNEGVEKKEKSLPNYYRGVFKEYAKELGELIIEGRLCNTYGFPAEAEARNLNKQQIIALAEHTMQLLLKTDRFTGMVARALVKVRDRIDAYSQYERDLVAAKKNNTLKKFKKKTIPPFPASHFSGNVVDLKFPGVEIETTINAFTSILEWGTTMGIVRSSRYEVSHFHIVLER